MSKEVAKQSFQGGKTKGSKSEFDEYVNKVEKKPLGELEKLFKSIHNGTAKEDLRGLNESVFNTVIFEGEDKDGHIYESITVQDIVDNPINIVKGLGIEAIDSYPFLEGIFKWIFLRDVKDYNHTKSVEGDISPIADGYYKNIKNVELGSYEKVTEKEVDMLNEIQQNKGPRAQRVLDLYRSETSINKQLTGPEFIELIRDIGRACEDYGLQKDIFIPYVLGTIKKESSFKRMAWNKSGATGFGQHMTQYLPKRILLAARTLKKRGVDYDETSVKEAASFFKKPKEIRKDRSRWPKDVERLVFGSKMQSYMTIELTRGNFNRLKSSLGKRAETYELYDYLYLAHNMGLGNALKIAKGEPLGTWAMRRLKMLKEKKIISGVTNFAVKMRKELYGSKEINMV